MSTTTVTVTGMSCGHCATSVREEIGDIPGVHAVEVDLASGNVTIDSDSAHRGHGDQNRRRGRRLPAGRLMKTGQKVAAFVVGLAAVFALSVWVGNTVGPHDATVERTAAELPGGLQSTQDGYTLALADSIATADPERAAAVPHRESDRSTGEAVRDRLTRSCCT